MLAAANGWRFATPCRIRWMTQKVTLDSVDREIVRHLQNDARMSNKALAARVGVAPSTCLERTNRLVRLGVVTGFHARVGAKAVGRGVQAFLAVQFLAHARPLVGPFVSWVCDLPETLDVHHVTGGDDFLVHIACADTDDLQRVVLEFTARREVGRVQTHLIFESWGGGPVRPV